MRPTAKIEVCGSIFTESYICNFTFSQNHFLKLFLEAIFVAGFDERKVHGMPSEFSLEFGSAMLMVRSPKMMSWY